MRRIVRTAMAAIRDSNLGDGDRLRFAKILAGRFVMDDVDGSPDERPQTVVEIAEPST